MTHPLTGRASRATRLGRPFAGVRVVYLSRTKSLVLDPEPGEPICILKSDTLLVRVPDTLKVTDPDGKVIKAARGFAMTIETFDPYHLVVDAPEDWPG